MHGIDRQHAAGSPLRSTPDVLPGSSLRRQMIERAWMPAMALMVALGFALGFTVAAALIGYARLPWLVLVIAGAAAAVGAMLAIWFYVRGTLPVLDDFARGIQGEAAVADCLQALRADGYQILHDLPLDNTLESSANIDHVAIGPGGIFVIETKYRSKRQGEEIRFDGHRLTIGGSTNANAVGQTIGNARRIAAILSEVTGRSVEARPVLVFPGRWWIEDTRHRGGRDSIWVLNDEALVKWIRNAPATLSPEDIALYATRLREYARRV